MNFMNNEDDNIRKSVAQRIRWSGIRAFNNTFNI